MKQALFLIVLLSLAGRLWAVSEALFTSVTGKVEIKGHKGHMLRIAHKDVTVVEGERIITGANAQATLQTFDGSEIQISPNTDVWMEKLRKPDANDKVIQFKMEMGQLMAQVKHLFSAQSSFEISAGGVVCGVRGTQYQVKYDPSTHTVYLGVLDGTVYAGSNGKRGITARAAARSFETAFRSAGPTMGFREKPPKARPQEFLPIHSMRWKISFRSAFPPTITGSSPIPRWRVPSGSNCRPIFRPGRTYHDPGNLPEKGHARNRPVHNCPPRQRGPTEPGFHLRRMESNYTTQQTQSSTSYGSEY